MAAPGFAEDRPFLQGRPPMVAVPERPDPEVRERPTRRSFTVDYKLRILAEADACAEARQIGALLRREGLYYSHLRHWRQQRTAGGRAALAQPRGRKPAAAQASELVRVQQQNAQLNRRLAIAEEIIAVQKKVAGLLGLTLEEPLSP
jgi:transposase-like protein